jgi:hypothetical protein
MELTFLMGGLLREADRGRLSKGFNKGRTEMEYEVRVSEEYLEALEASRKASAEFHAVAAKYKNGEIGDREFLTARAVHVRALKAFDVAFATEAHWTINPLILVD